MVDGEFFYEDWGARFSFKRNGGKYEGRKSEIMIGNTAHEGSVIKFIMIGSLKQDSRPDIKILMTSLSKISIARR